MPGDGRPATRCTPNSPRSLCPGLGRKRPHMHAAQHSAHLSRERLASSKQLCCPLKNALLGQATECRKVRVRWNSESTEFEWPCKGNGRGNGHAYFDVAEPGQDSVNAVIPSGQHFRVERLKGFPSPCILFEPSICNIRLYCFPRLPSCQAIYEDGKCHLLHY